jgi:hypothetical protein
MPRICISYRRSDSIAITGRIYDHLVSRYGSQSVFMDLNDIPYGADYRKQIQRAFQETSVLIAVIGPGWLGRQGPGIVRIQDEQDPVRVEIQDALAQQLLLIPILVDGAVMPSAAELPQSISELSYRNAMNVDSGVDFQPHMERLMKLLDPLFKIENEGATAAVFPGNSLAPPRATATAIVDPSSGLSRDGARLSSLVPYFVTLTILMLLAHYMIVIIGDLNPNYLSVAAIIIPLPVGFLLFRKLRVSAGPAALLGLAAAVTSVAGMLTVVGLIDAHSILPADSAEWQEVGQYVVSLTLATAAGSLIARVASKMNLNRAGLF